MRTVIAVGLAVALLMAILYVGNRGEQMAHVNFSSGALLAFMKNWERHEKPTDAALTNLLDRCASSSFGSFKPFVFTNTVSVAGTNFHCLFGFRDNFPEDGVLAITPEETMILVCPSGNKFIWAPQSSDKLRDYLSLGTGTLNVLVLKWKKQGEPTNSVLTNLLTGFRTLKPFVFTNTVSIAGTNYHCLFGLRDSRFQEDGVLAITPDRSVIWVGPSGNKFIWAPY